MDAEKLCAVYKLSLFCVVYGGSHGLSVLGALKVAYVMNCEVDSVNSGRCGDAQRPALALPYSWGGVAGLSYAFLRMRLPLSAGLRASIYPLLAHCWSSS